MNTFPKKRDVPSTRVGSEIVAFNEDKGQAVCLNQVSAVVWNLCNGRLSIAGIAEAATIELKAPVTVELVEFALRELRSKDLLEKGEVALLAGMSRRNLVRQLGTSAALLLPIVSMVAIPKQAHASNGGGGGGGCVPADTPIQLADGAWIPAVDVRAGMWLRAFDAETCELRDGRVEGVRKVAAPSIHRLFTERGDVLQSSPSHLLIAGAGNLDGTPVMRLKAGDAVMVYEPGDKRMVADRLSGVQISEVPCVVYGIEMASMEHTYVSAGLVSHNVYIKSVPAIPRAQITEQMREANEQTSAATRQVDPQVGWEFDR